MSIEDLKQDIKKGNIRSVYLFYGSEEYLKKYYLDSIEKLILFSGPVQLNKVVLDGKADIGNIIDNCETLPVLSDRKLVVVKNSGLFKSKVGGEEKRVKGRGKGKSSQSDQFAAFLQNPPRHTCLVFYEEQIDKRLKQLIEAVKNTGLIVEFGFQKPADLVRWAVKVFHSYKKEIDTNTASQLVEYCEQGMTEVLNEISKIVMYTGDRARITGKDIDEVCTRSVKSRIFDLTDAIAQQNASKALSLLNDMITLKEPLPRILFMIARQFRHILEMKLLKSEGVNMNEAAKKIGITPYAAGKALRQAGSFSTDQLKRLMEECLVADIAIKSGKMDERVAVELLIFKAQE